MFSKNIQDSLKSISFILIFFLVQNFHTVFLFCQLVNSIVLGNRIIGVFLIIPDVAFVASQSLIHCLGTFSDIFFIATFACQAVYAVVALTIEIASYLQGNIF